MKGLASLSCLYYLRLPSHLPFSRRSVRTSFWLPNIPSIPRFQSWVPWFPLFPRILHSRYNCQRFHQHVQHGKVPKPFGRPLLIESPLYLTCVHLSISPSRLTTLHTIPSHPSACLVSLGTAYHPAVAAVQAMPRDYVCW